MAVISHYKYMVHDCYAVQSFEIYALISVYWIGGKAFKLVCPNKSNPCRQRSLL